MLSTLPWTELTAAGLLVVDVGRGLLDTGAPAEGRIGHCDSERHLRMTAGRCWRAGRRATADRAGDDTDDREDDNPFGPVIT